MKKDEENLLKQILFLTFARILPKIPRFSSLINSTKKFLLCSAITGILLSSLILIVFLQFYQLLIILSFSKFNALNIIALGIFITFLISYYLAKRYFKKIDISENTDEKSIKKKTDDVLSILATSFIEGFCNEKSKAEEQSKYFDQEK